MFLWHFQWFSLLSVTALYWETWVLAADLKTVYINCEIEEQPLGESSIPLSPTDIASHVHSFRTYQKMEQFQLDGWKILYLVVAFLSVVKALTKEIRVLSNQGENNPGAYTSCMIVLTIWSLWKKDCCNLDRTQVCKSRRASQMVSLNYE